MNYIEMSLECQLCRMVNDDVSCKECKQLDRCQQEINNVTNKQTTRSKTASR